jgi:dihydrofolate reductase
MANVFIHITMSLDGLIARPNDEIDWAFHYGTDHMVGAVMEEIGAVVVGNRGFKEGTMNESRLPYGGMVKVPHFVVTHEAREPVTIGDLTFTFLTEGIERAIEVARHAAGEKKISLIGASIDQQCLKAGLVDEIVIHLVPIVLGEGIRLFDHLGSESIELERTEVVATSQITSLRFRVVK